MIFLQILFSQCDSLLYSESEYYHYTSLDIDHIGSTIDCYYIDDWDILNDLITINNLSTPESGYEGFAFPGIGIFLAIVIALLTILFKNPKNKSLNLRAYYPIIAVSLVAYFFALSNNITLGQNIIYTYQVPDYNTFLTKTIRSSGRIVWILF